MDQSVSRAVHTASPSGRDTDWSTIVALYGRLARVDPSPVVRLNRAVAVAEVDGPAVGLAEVDRLGEALDGYHAFHAARADLLRRLGRSSSRLVSSTTSGSGVAPPATAATLPWPSRASCRGPQRPSWSRRRVR